MLVLFSVSLSSVTLGHGELPKERTPLKCILKHFREGFIDENDYDICLSSGKLRELEWPALSVGCSTEGTLDAQTACAIWDMITRDPRHPD